MGNINNTKIVIINGMARCGKDTFMDMCSKIIPIERYSTIDYFKYIAREFFDWDGNKDEKGRSLLSALKIASIHYNNLPCLKFYDAYEKIIQENPTVKIVFCVCRDIEDIETIKNKYSDKVITLIIHNNRVPHISTNVGDNNVYDFKYDYIIENNGTFDELEASAETFIEDILQ